jgi:hypothetical protein
MLIVQHIWMRWTKRSRGANSPLKRPRLEEAYALPRPEGEDAALVHEIGAVEEHEGFAIENGLGPVDLETRRRRGRWHEALLDWRIDKDEVAISLARPSSRLQTKWPAFLPSPLFTLHPGDIVRIDWNGRLRMSMGDSNRSTYYEQHLYWLALADAPEPRLFLDAEPRKHVDLRTEIY